jgi:phospholipid/cholesterol/gamma-HCH transport system ATP-binding protein
LTVGTVDEVRNSSNERVQDLLNRRFEEEELDPEEYLRRLMGETQDSDQTEDSD